MYWPLNVARRLVPPALPLGGQVDDADDDADASLDDAIQLSPSPSSQHPQHFAVVTPRSLHIYTTRPTQAVASLRRTKKSIHDYGRNVRASWRPSTSSAITLVVETSASYVLVYNVKPSSNEPAYTYTPASSSQASASKKPWAPSAKSLKSTFAAASGEGAVGALPLEISLRLALRVDATLACCLATTDFLLVSTIEPPALQAIPWPGEGEGPAGAETKTTLLSSLAWYRAQGGEDSPSSHVSTIVHSRRMDLYVWLTSDGQGYVASFKADAEPVWKGRRFHSPSTTRRASSSASTVAPSRIGGSGSPARCAAINAKMGLIAVGREDGLVTVYILRSQTKAVVSHTFSLRKSLQSTASFLKPGVVQTLEWTADGLALAVGWDNGWAVWSTWGKLMGHSFLDESPSQRNRGFGDAFMDGVKDVFWGPGGTDLFVLANASTSTSTRLRQLFVVPHAKSAVAGQHSPDNTRFAFIQLDDAVLVYRGSDQPDVSIINPDSDVWQHIKIPQPYVAAQWPIRYAAISPDGLLIAVAGRRGLAHYSSVSGRWKTFAKESDEASFAVRGGLQWFEHVLIVACQTSSDGTRPSSSQLRLYSRDDELLNSNVLHIEELPSPVVLTSLFEDSLLVYTSDNTFYHFLLVVSKERIELQLCGSITFEGVVGEPERVRGLSWMIPRSQQRFGDPMDDLTVATIIFLVDGKLVLLRPRKITGNKAQVNGAAQGEEAEEVAYDMQILGDRIEYYWTHLSGIGTLENSLWGYDGSGIKLWLDALTIEQAEPRRQVIAGGQDDGDGDDGHQDAEANDDEEEEMPEYKTIEESLSMPLDFYPLCVVLEKGIIVGIEPEVSLRKSLDFAIFRSATTTHLFLDRLLRHYLEAGRMKEAVLCANSYKELVYFPHALEVLLHAVLEDEADALSEQGVTPSASANSLPASASNESIVEHLGDSDNEEFDTHDTAAAPRRDALLPRIIDFLDHFPSSLSILVSCARKTEVRRWSYLFHPSNLGEGVTPRVLFERCLQEGDWGTAGGWLIVLHTLSGPEASGTGVSGGTEDKEELTARLLTLVAENPTSSSSRSRGGGDGWLLCRDLLRYTKSMDESGRSLRKVLRLAGWDSPDDKAQAEEATAPSSPETTRLAVPRPKTMKRNPSSSARMTTLDSVPQEQDEDEEQASGGPASVPALSVNGQAVSPTASRSPPLLRRSLSGSSSSSTGAGGMYRVGLGGGASKVMGMGAPWRAGAAVGSGVDAAGRRASVTSSSGSTTASRDDIAGGDK